MKSSSNLHTHSSHSSSNPKIRVVAAEIEWDEHILITQRREQAIYPLYWEFPSGKVEKDETDLHALQRAIKERLGIDITVGACSLFVTHHYVSYSVDFYLYQCQLSNQKQEIQSLKVKDWRWIRLNEIQNFPFPPADAEIFRHLHY